MQAEHRIASILALGEVFLSAVASSKSGAAFGQIGTCAATVVLTVRSQSAAGYVVPVNVGNARFSVARRLASALLTGLKR